MPDSPDHIVPINKDAQSEAQRFSEEHGRELLTILFTDLVDSTKQQSDLGNAEAARITEVHRAIVREELSKYDAREIEWAGDSCLAVFTKPSDAVVFALRMQAEHRLVRETETKLPTVRVGIHLGEIIVKHGDGKEDLFGLQVSETARVMSVADGNQIYCTRAVFDNARSSLTSESIEGVGEVFWVRHGMYMLKGSADPLELCEVGSREVTVSSAPHASDKVTPVASERSKAGLLIPAVVFGVLVAAAMVALQFLMPQEDGQTLNTVSEAPLEIEVMMHGFNVAPMREVEAGQRLAISPDGRRVVYVSLNGDGEKQLALWNEGDLDGELIPGTERAKVPFFSPDGESVGFFVEGDGLLTRIDIDGSNRIEICDVGRATDAVWADDGTIVFGSFSFRGLQRVRDTGGEPERISSVEDTPGAIGHLFPHILPEGKGILFTAFGGMTSELNFPIYLRTPDDSLRKIIEFGAYPRYAASGHLVYLARRGVTFRRFDLDTLEVGAEEFVSEEKRLPRGPTASYDLARSGTFAYVMADSRPNVGATAALRTLVWVDVDSGDEEEIRIDEKSYSNARISPEGKRIALDDGADVFVYDIAQQSLMAFAYHERIPEIIPIWTPDGLNITYAAQANFVLSMYTKSADGTGSHVLVQDSRLQQFPEYWADGGNTLVYGEEGVGTSWDMGVLHAGDDADRYSELVVNTRHGEGTPSVSKDERWIAYNSLENGIGRIYVSSFPGFQDKWMVAEGEGVRHPLWAPDGSALYYLDGADMMRLNVETEPTFRARNTEPLWDAPYHFTIRRGFDIDAAGERFLMIKDVEASRPSNENENVAVIKNWTLKLEQIESEAKGTQ